MERIDELINAKLDTPEGDELDILVTLVDAYEAKHFPMHVLKGCAILL